MRSPEKTPTRTLSKHDKTVALASNLARAHGIVEGGLIAGGCIEVFTMHTGGPLLNLALIELPAALISAGNFIHRESEPPKIE